MERECVKVVVRCRPLSQKELTEKHGTIVDIDETEGSILLKHPSSQESPKAFTFDNAFGPDCLQIDVYNKTARPIVEAVLNGYNGTIFAYGQTGSGKTFSMTGVRDHPQLKGILPHSFDHIFAHIGSADTATRYLVRASYLEIYNEEIRDLLSPPPTNKPPIRLELKEHAEIGVYVKDLSSYVVKDAQEIDKLLSMGSKNRSVGATLMNAESSRSHSIFTITIEMASQSEEDKKEHIRVGKLHLVDLAGSERQSKTGATGERLKEAAKINLSLTALGNVIAALVDGKSSHIPYRDSKLTRLLQDSLGGNSKTVMIATMSPASYNYDETLSTLRYANRTKQIKNKPKINEDPKDTMLREFQDEIKRLKEQLEGMGSIPVEQGEEAASEPEDDEDEEAVENLHRPAPRKVRSREKVDPQAQKALRENVEKFYQNQLSQLDQERQALIQSQGMVETEKQRLLQVVEERARELETEQQLRQEVALKLQQMEAKLLVGGENILDKAEQHEQELVRQAAELEAQRQRERELQRELERQQEKRFQIEENYSTLQEEAEAKTDKLQKVWNMWMKSKEEIQDIQNEFFRQKEELLETIHDLAVELKMKSLIVDQFISQPYVQLIERHAVYDAENDAWNIPYIAQAGNHVNHQSRYQRREDSQHSFQQIYSHPLVLFPDLNLSYDMYIQGGIDEKPRQPSTIRPASVNGRGRPQSSLGKQTRPKSRMQAASMERSVSGLSKSQLSMDALPESRGLVASGKRYA